MYVYTHTLQISPASIALPLSSLSCRNGPEQAGIAECNACPCLRLGCNVPGTWPVYTATTTPYFVTDTHTIQILEKQYTWHNHGWTQLPSTLFSLLRSASIPFLDLSSTPKPPIQLSWAAFPRRRSPSFDAVQPPKTIS
jgi:hypothetical protein